MNKPNTSTFLITARAQISKQGAKQLVLDLPMRLRRLAAVFVFLPTFLTPCFAHHMAVVVHRDNKVGNIAAAQLAKIFRSETKEWPDGQVVVLVLNRHLGAETKTLERLTKMSEGAWNARIAAHNHSIQVADSDAEVLKIVQSTPGAVGLVDVRSINDTVRVVRVGGKLPMEAGYLPH